MDDDLAVPLRGQQYLELGIVEDRAVDVPVGNRCGANLVGVDNRRDDGLAVVGDAVCGVLMGRRAQGRESRESQGDDGS
jgi:hypothetical protein